MKTISYMVVMIGLVWSRSRVFNSNVTMIGMVQADEQCKLNP